MGVKHQPESFSVVAQMLLQQGLHLQQLGVGNDLQQALCIYVARRVQLQTPPQASSLILSMLCNVAQCTFGLCQSPYVSTTNAASIAVMHVNRSMIWVMHIGDASSGVESITCLSALL